MSNLPSDQDIKSALAEKKTPAMQVTLSTGKVVILRHPKIVDMEDASMVAGHGIQGNNPGMGVKLNRQLISRLLLQVNGKNLTLVETEQMDALFTVPEFLQLTQAINEAMGAGAKDFQPKVESVTV